MTTDWQQPFVETTWEARLVIAGFTLTSLGLPATTAVMIFTNATQRLAMWTFMTAWIGAVLLSIVLLRTSKRVLGSYYPILRPVAMLQLQFRFIGRAAFESATKLELPKGLASTLTLATTLGFVSMCLGILVLSATA